MLLRDELLEREAFDTLLEALEAKRAELKEEQRRNRWPPVTTVKEQEVVVALTQFREVLLADVGRATPFLRTPVSAAYRCSIVSLLE